MELLTGKARAAREAAGKISSAHRGLQGRLGMAYALDALPEDELVVLRRIAREFCESLTEVLLLRREAETSGKRKKQEPGEGKER